MFMFTSEFFVSLHRLRIAGNWRQTRERRAQVTAELAVGGAYEDCYCLCVPLPFLRERNSIFLNEDSQ